MVKPKTQGASLHIFSGAATSLRPGKIDLLEAIARSGSLSAAACAIDMSCWRAWILVDTMNCRFRDDLVVTAIGGHGGGRVKPFGMDTQARYRRAEAKASAAAGDKVAAFAGWWRGPVDGFDGAPQFRGR